MEMPVPINIKTLFELEVLRARLEIRDFFLKNLFREVYENIGQVLSLVRVMLASPGAGTERASELVGKSIRDLRQMCKSFFPDADLLQQNGFANGIKETVEIIYPGSQSIKLIEATDDIEPGRMLIVFSLV